MPSPWGVVQDSQGRWNKYGGRLPWGTEAICSDNATFGGTGHPKRGEDYTAAPNIDHAQQRVRDDLKAWLKWLKGSIGFDGWRFDFVKGYGALQPLLAGTWVASLEYLCTVCSL